MVLAPAPALEVSIEDRGDRHGVHFHAAGQGFWVSQLMAALGVQVTLCGTFGGEVGDVVRAVIERRGVDVRAVASRTANGLSIRVDRGGTSTVFADEGPLSLTRHELDDLYGVAAVAGLDADVCVLAGSTAGGTTMPADFYRRLASDLVSNGRTVVADLSGAALEASASAGVAVLKASAEDLVRDGRAATDDVGDVLAAVDDLRAAGASIVLVSRGPRPALARLGDETVEIVGPKLAAFQEHGAGDAMTAGVASGLAFGRSAEDALRLGVAAGTLNVSRHGFGTGTRSEIEQLVEHVALGPADQGRPSKPVRTTPDELAAKVRPT
jgi:1-phosphofructokinase